MSAKPKPAKKSEKPSNAVETKILVSSNGPGSSESANQHDVVSMFLRTWAGLHNIDHGCHEGTESCDMIMAGILSVIANTNFKNGQRAGQTSVVKAKCAECGVEAPFLTYLGAQPDESLLCLKCQGLKDMKARVQARILPLKPDSWSSPLNGIPSNRRD